MIQRNSLVFLSTLLVVLLLNISGGRANDFWVKPSSTQSSSNCGSSQLLACPNIIDLLNLKLLNIGDTIHLLPGVYKGIGLNVGLNIDIANIQIIGTDAASVIIDLEGSPTFITISVPGVVVAQVTIRNGITADVDLGVINIRLTVGATVNALLDALRFNNVNFLNIQGTAILVADVNVLNGLVDIKVNANIFVNVVLSGCSFVNVTVDPVLKVVGRISLRLNSVSFDNCGSPDVDGSIVLAQQSSAVVLVSVSISNCQGGSLLDLNTAATLTLNGLLVLNANVVSTSLLNLNLNLNINILGLSVRLESNTAPIACTNVKCGLINIGSVCSNCGLINLDLGSFF
jgi:hypothetical protein